jgi:rubrerythrin
MRQLTLVCAAAALVLSAGCKPPPKEQAKDMFLNDVRLYFNELNREAMERKERLRSELARAKTNPHFDAATGTVYNTFSFDPDGFVVENYKCQSCGTVLALPIAAAEYLCKSCGHSPYRSHTGVNKSVSPCPTCSGADGKLKALTDDLVSKDSIKQREGALVKDMFEMTQENPEKPLVAKVRYVRRLWVFDPRGTVKISQAAQTKAAVDMTWLPSEGGAFDPTSPTSKYSVPGFHRLDGVYLGEIEFVWKGGTLTEKSRLAETPVRPWKDLTTVGK